MFKNICSRVFFQSPLPGLVGFGFRFQKSSSWVTSVIRGGWGGAIGKFLAGCKRYNQDHNIKKYFLFLQNILQAFVQSYIQNLDFYSDQPYELIHLSNVLPVYPKY